MPKTIRSTAITESALILEARAGQTAALLQALISGSLIDVVDANGAVIGGGGGVNSILYSSRAANTILGAADRAKVISATATFTQTLTAAATLTAGWWCILQNNTTDGITILTVDPNGAETVDGLATMVMYSGEVRLLICDGTNFFSIMYQGGYAKFIATGNFIGPAGCKRVDYDLIAPGGVGGAGTGAAAGNARPGGSGGGGGARSQGFLPASAFTPGATHAVTLSTSTTTFMSAQAYKGGAGQPGDPANDFSGGSGGGIGEFGYPGDVVAIPGGGHRLPDTAGISGNWPMSGMGGAGGDADPATSHGIGADWGGGSGGPNKKAPSGTGAPGGTSCRGGGGGAAGGGVSVGNAAFNGGVGGNSGFFTETGGNGGGAGGANTGAPGVAGADWTSSQSGKGGGGGGGNTAGTGGAGGNGGIPGGGGGGGGGGTPTGGAGGTGGRGEGRITYS